MKRIACEIRIVAERRVRNLRVVVAELPETGSGLTGRPELVVYELTVVRMPRADDPVAPKGHNRGSVTPGLAVPEKVSGSPSLQVPDPMVFERELRPTIAANLVAGQGRGRQAIGGKTGPLP